MAIRLNLTSQTQCHEQENGYTKEMCGNLTESISSKAGIAAIFHLLSSANVIALCFCFMLKLFMTICVQTLPSYVS